MNKTDPYFFKNIKGLLHACQDLTSEIYFSDDEEQTTVNMDEITYIVGNIAYYQKQHGQVDEVWQQIMKYALMPTLNDSCFRYITDDLKNENYAFIKSLCTELLDYIKYIEEKSDSRELVSVGDIKKA